MAEFPAFPLWTDALVADTDHLGNEEFGLYLRLLIIMWRSPRQRVPNDLSWLTRRCRCTADAMQMLITEFCQTDGNWITQKRLLKEWNFVSELTKKRTEAAKLRWNKNKGGMQSISNADAKHEPSYAPTPTPTPPKKEEKEVAPNGAYAFHGRVVKLNQHDLTKWEKSYTYLNGTMAGLLESRDAYLSSPDCSDADRKKWFMSTAAWLAKKNEEAKAKAPAKKSRNPIVGSPEWRAAYGMDEDGK